MSRAPRRSSDKRAVSGTAVLDGVERGVGRSISAEEKANWLQRCKLTRHDPAAAKKCLFALATRRRDEDLLPDCNRLFVELKYERQMELIDHFTGGLAAERDLRIVHGSRVEVPRVMLWLLNLPAGASLPDRHWSAVKAWAAGRFKLTSPPASALFFPEPGARADWISAVGGMGHFGLKGGDDPIQWVQHRASGRWKKLPFKIPARHLAHWRINRNWELGAAQLQNKAGSQAVKLALHFGKDLQDRRVILYEMINDTGQSNFRGLLAGLIQVLAH